MPSGVGHYEVLVGLIAAIVILELGARRLKLPPAVAFIVGGGAIALLPGVPSLSLDPALVMLVFLPPLLMNGGYFTSWAEFRSNLAAISLLAVGAVVFTTVCVGVAAHALAPGLSWPVAFALGAIVSPPDAVAAAAVLKRLSLPARVTATLEGESLLNDASGLVLFRFALAAALTGGFSPVQAGWSFVVVSAGGLALGWAAGAAGVFVLKRLQDSELSIIASLLLPAVTYIVADRLGVSGVLAVVVAGILVGRRQHAVLSAATRMRAHAFWRVLVFLLESTLFVLIGLALRDVLARLTHTSHALFSIGAPVLGVVAATILSRLVWMLGSWLVRCALWSAGARWIAEPSLPTAAVLSWAGMRGVVTLAAALSLPTSLAGRDLVLVAAFAVILATVLIQGLTLGPLIQALGLSGADEATRRAESEHEAWAQMMQAQYEAIAQLSKQDGGGEAHPRLLEQYGRRAELARQYITEREPHALAKRVHHQAVLSAIQAGRAEVLKLHAHGDIHDEVLRSLERELDLQQLVAESHAD